jgi:hypothetical protein
MLTMPAAGHGVPELAENEMMNKLENTYGKTM